jgi:hypothetical protein
MHSFKLVDSLEVTRTVKVRVPSDGDAFETQTFRARFRILDSEEATALAQDGRDDIALCEAVLVGLPDGIATEADGQVEDSAELRRRLIRIPYVRLGIVQAYTRASLGIEEKN